MHFRHVLVGSLALGALATLVTACVGTVEGHDPSAEEDAVSQDGLRDGPIEPAKRIICSGDADACVRQCHYAGVACLTRVEHPSKPDVGIGDLYACRTTTPRSCDYKFANGETCAFFKHPNTVLCVP